MKDGKPESQKQSRLENKKSETGKFLTTNQGVRVNDTDNSLKAGER